MKVYRVVSAPFVTNNRLEQRLSHSLVYYQVGYSSFISKMSCHHDNNGLAKKYKRRGKIFFAFAGDAIKEANSLISGYHRQSTTVSLFIE